MSAYKEAERSYMSLEWERIAKAEMKRRKGVEDDRDELLRKQIEGPATNWHTAGTVTIMVGGAFPVEYDILYSIRRRTTNAEQTSGEESNNE